MIWPESSTGEKDGCQEPTIHGVQNNPLWLQWRVCFEIAYNSSGSLQIQHLLISLHRSNPSNWMAIEEGLSGFFP
jgi:hypothetical protein